MAERANWIWQRSLGTSGVNRKWMARFISEIQDGREVPARGETRTGKARPISEVDIDTFRIETRRELEMFISFTRAPEYDLFGKVGTDQKRKQLQQSIDFLTAEFHMRQRNDFEGLEHLHDKDLVGSPGKDLSVLQIMRKKAKERGIAEIPGNKKLLSPETYSAGPRNNPNGTPMMDPDTGKQVTSSQPHHVSTIFGFAGGFSDVEYAEERGGKRAKGKRATRTDREARRLADHAIFSMGEA